MRQPVEVRDATGDWLNAIAVSRVEPTHRDGRKIHDFPVVWVRFGDGDPRVRPAIPWPAEDVRWPEGANQ